MGEGTSPDRKPSPTIVIPTLGTILRGRVGIHSVAVVPLANLRCSTHVAELQEFTRVTPCVADVSKDWGSRVWFFLAASPMEKRTTKSRAD